jgi:peroxiredoxin
VAVIGSGGLGTPIVRAMKLPMPVLVDKDKSAYRRYGLETALGVIQKSATFIIDRHRIVRWRRASFNPYEVVDRGEVDRVLRSLRG